MQSANAIQWLDLQPFLERVCDQMSVGELLHDESFSLFESMTAIEIGDPKMDLGLRKHQDVDTPEELIEAGQAPIDLSAQQLLGLMDRLMVLEAAWHHGALLPQTVFTSLYMLQIDRLGGHPVLQSFCQALRTACTVVRDLVINGQVCEDEDFSIYTCGLYLDPPGLAPPAAALQSLAEMERYLDEQLKDSRMVGGRVKKGSSQEAALESTRALLSRIRFRRYFQEALQHLQQPTTQSLEAARSCCQVAVEELQVLRDSCHLASAGDPPGFVPDINRRHMGLVPPRHIKELTKDEMVDHFSALMAGLASVCTSLLSVHCWRDLEGALVQFAAMPSSPITRSLMHLLLSLPLKRTAHAQAVADTARSRAQGAPPAAGLEPEQGLDPSAHGRHTSQYSSSGTIGGTCGDPSQQKHSLPAWCPSPEMVCKEFGWQMHALPGADVALFVEQCAIALQGWCHAMCVNRARQRRRLRHLLEDWRNMVDHGMNADMSPELAGWMSQQGWRWMPLDEAGEEPQGPVATWVEREACTTMLAHLMLGFQLDLYQPYEYRSVYWYCDYLIGTQQQASRMLQSARPSAAAQQAQQAEVQAKPSRSARRPKHESKAVGATPPPQPQEVSLEEHWRTLQFMSMEVERMMCQGMMKMATGLQVLGCIPEPDEAFSKEAQRFEQRFAALQILPCPQPLCYEHFQSSMKTNGLAADAFFAMAFENFFKAQHGAIALLQGPASKLLAPHEVKHFEGIKRIALQNSMALKIMISVARRQQDERKQVAEQGKDYEQSVAEEVRVEAEHHIYKQQTLVATTTRAAVCKQKPLFHVNWDFTICFQNSVSSFYPVIALRSKS